MLLLRISPMPRSSAVRSVRRLATTAYLRSEHNPHSKIHALPFKLSEKKANELIDLTAYVNEHTFVSFFKILASAITRRKPKVDEKARDLELRKAYLPFWYLDIAVSGTGSVLNASNEEDEQSKNTMLGMAFDSFWPGFVFDPLHYVSFGKPHNQDIQDAVPFSPKMYDHLDDVQVFPFTVSPLLDIADRVPLADGLQIEDKDIKFQLRDMKLEFAAAYPLYWPVYIAKYKIGDGDKEDGRTIVLAAHKDDPFFLQWEPDMQGHKQWLNNGSWLNADVTEPFWKMGKSQRKVLHAAENMYLNDLVGQFGVGGDEINWDDKRILGYPAHNLENKDYLTKLFSLFAKSSMLNMLRTQDTSVVGVGKGKIEVLPVEKMVQNTEKEIQAAKEELESSRPKWMEE